MTTQNRSGWGIVAFVWKDLALAAIALGIGLFLFFFAKKLGATDFSPISFCLAALVGFEAFLKALPLMPNRLRVWQWLMGIDIACAVVSMILALITGSSHALAAAGLWGVAGIAIFSATFIFPVFKPNDDSQPDDQTH